MSTDTPPTPPAPPAPQPLPLSVRHIAARLKAAEALAELSTCTRRRFAAVIIDPNTRAVIADGYNGPPRNGPKLCGGEVCERDAQAIPSGSDLATGCYHAELNAILNAARQGAHTQGALMLCTGAPCLACARAIYHAGISAVITRAGSYPIGEDAGRVFLSAYGVRIYYVASL